MSDVRAAFENGLIVLNGTFEGRKQRMLGIFGYAAWFGAFACFIIVLIRQFESAGVAHGVIGIITCGIWTFIWGWINAGEENIKSLMLLWTLLVVVRGGFHLFSGSMPVW